MRIQFSLFTVFVITILAASLSEYVRRTILPSLRIANSVIDIGVVHVGEIHYQAFEIENLGDRDMTVVGHSTPCPGVFEQREPIVIAKGSKEQIKIGLLIRDKALADKPQAYRFTIKTDDPAAPKLEFQLIAHCKSD